MAAQAQEDSRNIMAMSGGAANDATNDMAVLGSALFSWQCLDAGGREVGQKEGIRRA